MNNFGKKFIFLFSIQLLLSFFVFASRKDKIEDKEAQNLNSWQENFDLENKKTGKYNIMITAKDLGGNVMVEGPFNIYYDPKSDLPVCGITNPYPDMRVVSNLNIVGTCIDDDGVEYVELILDGDEENPIRAEGKEFWSYYLNTLNLEEGPHTIKVIGYDINGLAGNPVSLTWQLDRNQPLTQITDKEMGLLVAGNVRFDGIVSDGNGISSLEYSVDGGKYFKPVKINTKKQESEFSISVDTKKFEDGPAILWFRATDKAGSVGLYSFLYFIDNTKPDVVIVSPKSDEKLNGKFSVAGYAKDTIGVTELSWTYENQSGIIELVPGNPYWCVNLDSTKTKEKSGKFTIRAVDRANNVVEVSKTIIFDQELDKPVINAVEPVANQIYNQNDAVYVRGLVKDDDGVQFVKIQLDNQEPIIIETKGAYFAKICEENQLSLGKHSIKIVATDINGIESNLSLTEIESKGFAPEFKSAKIGKTDFVNGMEVHPESNSIFSVDVISPIGIKSVHSTISWGKDGILEQDYETKNANSYTVSFPILPDSQKGVLQYKITATDSFDRISEYNAILYVTNTSLVKSDEPQIVLDDSRFSEEGIVINNFEFPASAYVLGGNAISVSLEPSTPFATAKLVGNQIQLVAKNAIGTSEQVVIRVTTDKGKILRSKPIRFKNDSAFPKLKINNEFGQNAINILNEESIIISGNVTCETGIGTTKYRIFPILAELKNGIISTVKLGSPTEYQTVPTQKNGNFDFEIPIMDVLSEGFYVVEVVSESLGGNTVAKGIPLSLIPEIQAINGKMPSPKSPAVVFLDGVDVYAVAIYQGELEQCFEQFSRIDMNEGSNSLSFTTTSSDGKSVVGKYNANKTPTLSANFALVDDKEYISGMPINLAYGDKIGKTLTLYIDSSVPVTSVSYEISGDDVSGGDNKQSGSAKLVKPAEGETRWIAIIPLANLPSRVNKISAKVKAGSLEQILKGSITVIRESDKALIDDAEKIYAFPSTSTKFDSKNESYILSNGSQFYYYANYPSPLNVELVSNSDGLEISTEGKLITLSGKKDGYYKNVYLKITDGLGDVHTSEKLNFISNSTNPVLNLQTPEALQWIKNTVTLSGTAQHSLGIRTVEYSLDAGMSWKEFSIRTSQGNIGVTFNETLDIKNFEDGLFRINIRAIDNAGHSTQILTSCYKDTTPPTVEVIQPLSEDIINGKNLLVFNVKDESLLSSAEYVNGKSRLPLQISPLISTFIGTDEIPLDKPISFIFMDDAGNSTRISNWDFKIDNASDLPRTEIHVPEDMQVITRDFTISGVVYDDDGESTIFYKIDNGEYHQLPEKGTSFAIEVPLSTMTDNEHTVTVYAVDLNGVKGEETKRTFRISLEEPKGAVEKPTIDTSVKKLVTISGVASDKNGIKKVQVSLDNGNTYNDAVGTQRWSYTVDSRAIPGGTQVVFLKVTDNYGIQGLYSSLINIDNDAPYMTLELPLDDSSTTGTLFLSGYTYDNVEVSELYVTIRNLERPNSAIKKNIKIDRIIAETIDMSNLPDGFYNIELTGKDKAGNVTNISRNIHLDKSKDAANIDLLYPLNGEHKQGLFAIYGQTEAEYKISQLTLYVDGKLVSSTVPTNTEFFKFDMGPVITNEDGTTSYNISKGEHTYRVDATLENGQIVHSREQTLTYNPVGPWITIDNFTYGDFATNRPFITGRAGYALDEEEIAAAKEKDAPSELKEALAAKKLKKVELSLDNGKTFTELSTSAKWKYRVENEDIAEGYHFLLLKATMQNGETAINRIIIQVDNTKPSIKLIAPVAGGKYNQTLDVQGLSHDDVQLENVTITLRQGDKSSYEVPSFIQGLYLDLHFWGATLFDIGAGLTFFDDNVKLQGQFGQFTQEQRNAISKMLGQDSATMRYGGSHVLGLKILANVASIPFSYFFGRDWEWLYASFAIGAQFSWFDKTSSGKTQALSALLGQLEFPKVKLKNAKMFSSFALYTEFSLWFIPTDVATNGETEIQNLIPQFAIGLRTNIF